MHVHLGVLLAIVSFANVIVVGALWRFLTLWLGNHNHKDISSAMAFVY